MCYTNTFAQGASIGWNHLDGKYENKMNIPVRYFSDFMLNEFLKGAPKEDDR